MTDISVPHERVIANLERRLHAVVSENVMKDAAIEELQYQLETANDNIKNLMNPLAE